MPKSHTDYWTAKLAQNRLRDWLTRQDLESEGWTVLEVWEHEIDDELDECVARVKDAVMKSKVAPSRRLLLTQQPVGQSSRN